MTTVSNTLLVVVSSNLELIGTFNVKNAIPHTKPLN